ncbi:thioredoxin [Plakobranchus ocellatus]|uniref:Thioredoxin n=1 Tax=Plakobranchus ocellatus TaxID=259542 RepID=A0AAV3XZF8_9GAST|nr:thioredoxin [Plakobranchus ocellatus]
MLSFEGDQRPRAKLKAVTTKPIRSLLVYFQRGNTLHEMGNIRVICFPQEIPQLTKLSLSMSLKVGLRTALGHKRGCPLVLLGLIRRLKLYVCCMTPSHDGYCSDSMSWLQDQFDKIITETDTLVVVDFFANWCGPCRAIAPQLEVMAKEFEDEILFIKVDIDENEETTKASNVDATPTFHFYKGGNKIDVVVGASAKAVADKIRQYK